MKSMNHLRTFDSVGKIYENISFPQPPVFVSKFPLVAYPGKEGGLGYLMNA